MNKLLDIIDCQEATVEVLISADGGTVWINNHAQCIARISGITKLTVRDSRTLSTDDES